MTKKHLIFWSVLAIITIALIFFININTEAQQKDDSEDWPMFRLNLQHSGYKEGIAPDTNTTDWIFDTGSTQWVVCSPMIVDDYVYIGSDNGKFYKLYFENGTVVWSYTVGSSCYAQFWASPFVDKENNMVFVHANGVHAINMTTGERIWHFDTSRRGDFSSPVVHDGVVFFGTYSKHVYALNEMTGDVIWYYEAGEYQNGEHVDGTGGAVSTTLAFAKDKEGNGIVFGAEQTNYDEGNNYCDYNIFCLPEKEEEPNINGVIEHEEIIWKYEIGYHIPIIDTGIPGDNGDCFSSPSVNIELGQVYIGSRDHYFYAFDLEKDDDHIDNDADGIVDNEGKLLWRVEVDNEIFSSPSFHNGVVFFGSGRYSRSTPSPGSVYALRENNGQQVWHYQHDDGFLSSVLIADDNVYIGSNNDYLFAFDEESGDIIWSYFATGGSQAAFGSSSSLYKGKIVVGCCNGKVYAFKDPNSPPYLTLLSPKDSTIISSSQKLEWRGTDWDKGDQEKLVYDVYLDTNYENVENSMQSSLISKRQKEESFKPELIGGEKYYWKIVANDTELEGESEIWSFTVNIKPEISGFTPKDNDRVVSSSTRLSWDGYDLDGDELFYDVYFGENSNPKNVSNNQKDEYFDVSDLEIGDTYYWKIIVKDGVENISSPLLSFKYNTPPEIELSSPSDKARVKSTSLTLNWDGVDNDKDTLKYNVYLDTNPNPKTIVTNDINEEYYSPSELNEEETYYWKVVVNDGYQETESTIWQFTVNTPPTIELSSPSNNGRVISSSPTLYWKGNDKDDDSLVYNVYLDTYSEPKTLASENQIDEYYNAIGLTFGETYYWKVVVNDSYQKTESPIWKFTVNTPPIISLNSPSNAKRVVGTSVKLEWEGIDDDEDSLTYNVYFDEKAMPKNIVSEDNNKNFYEKGNLEKGVKYYWKVVINDGYEEITSEIRSIFVNSQPLITLLNPENFEEISSTSVQLSWDAEDKENDELNFNVYLDKKKPPEQKVSTSQKEYYYEAENLEIGETYYWKIVAYDGYEYKTSEIGEFKVGEDATSGDGIGEAKASVSSNDISFSKSEIFDDEEITITVIVHNNVQETLKGVEVWFFDGNPNNELLIYMEKVTIEANGIITVVAPWIAEKGSHTIYVVVDYQGVDSIAFKSIKVKEKVEDKDDDKIEIEWIAIPSVIVVVIVIGIAVGVKKKSKKKSYKKCPNCSSKMEYVSKYNDYYCYECEEYLENL